MSRRKAAAEMNREQRTRVRTTPERNSTILWPGTGAQLKLPLFSSSSATQFASLRHPKCRSKYGTRQIKFPSFNCSCTHGVYAREELQKTFIAFVHCLRRCRRRQRRRRQWRRQYVSVLQIQNLVSCATNIESEINSLHAKLKLNS